MVPWARCRWRGRPSICPTCCCRVSWPPASSKWGRRASGSSAIREGSGPTILETGSRVCEEDVVVARTPARRSTAAAGVDVDRLAAAPALVQPPPSHAFAGPPALRSSGPRQAIVATWQPSAVPHVYPPPPLGLGSAVLLDSRRGAYLIVALHLSSRQKNPRRIIGC